MKNKLNYIFGGLLFLILSGCAPAKLIQTQLNVLESYIPGEYDGELEDEDLWGNKREKVIARKCLEQAINSPDFDYLLTQGVKVIKASNDWKLNIKYPWETENMIYGNISTLDYYASCYGSRYIVEGSEKNLNLIDKLKEEYKKTLSMKQYSAELTTPDGEKTSENYVLGTIKPSSPDASLNVNSEDIKLVNHVKWLKDNNIFQFYLYKDKSVKMVQIIEETGQVIGPSTGNWFQNNENKYVLTFPAKEGEFILVFEYLIFTP
tara:strand:- start:803 stop:1591 length:789 start_codon:yes stop_codon:yes gene_type:complete